MEAIFMNLIWLRNGYMIEYLLICFFFLRKTFKINWDIKECQFINYSVIIGNEPREKNWKHDEINWNTMEILR